MANMKRVGMFLPVPLLARMKSVAKTSGLPVSELVRRAIEDFLSRRAK